MVNQLRENDSVVSLLMSAISTGESRLQNIPLLLKRVIREQMWREREMQSNGNVARFNQFMEFVATPPREGLGTDIETLQRLCRDDMEAQTLLYEAISHQGQRADLLYNIQEVPSAPSAPAGTSRARALIKLSADRPDLHERVLSKRCSPHAAMVEAGYLPRTITVRAEPEAAARTLLKHFTPLEVGRLIAALEEHG